MNKYERQLTERIESELNKRPRLAANLLIQRGSGYFVDGQIENGFKDFLLACQIDHLFSVWQLKTGMECFLNNFFKESIPFLTKALELAEPNDVDTIENALCDRAYSYGATMEFENALADCNQLVEFGNKWNNESTIENGILRKKEILKFIDLYNVEFDKDQFGCERLVEWGKIWNDESNIELDIGRKNKVIEIIAEYNMIVNSSRDSRI